MNGEKFFEDGLNIDEIYRKIAEDSGIDVGVVKDDMPPECVGIVARFLKNEGYRKEEIMRELLTIYGALVDVSQRFGRNEEEPMMEVRESCNVLEVLGPYGVTVARYIKESCPNVIKCV